MRRINGFLALALLLVSLPACEPAADPRDSTAGRVERLGRSGEVGSAGEVDATESRKTPPSALQELVAGNTGFSSEKGAALPSETSFIVANGLSESHISQVIQSDDQFRSAIRALERDAATDADAQFISKHYRLSAEAALDGMGRIAALSCGYVLCIGEVWLQGEQAYQRWDAEFGALGSSTPVYSMSEMSVPSSSKERIVRFVASIDSDKNSLSVE